MYARRFQVDLLAGGERRPCPQEWLDQFAMRDFTGSARFDDTLPLADGLIEAGFRVDAGKFAHDFSAWLT
ncbi:MAG TPA: hypothetical protein VGS20_11890, partial [Candidatus Acidoferrales bacterium]|nr:hypothetical protein [Candidatus Acidoferrales bacterium]